VSQLPTSGLEEVYRDLLVDALEGGQCILLLGSGVDVVGADGERHNLASELASSLAGELDRSFDDSATLPYIAQVYASKKGSVRMLTKKVRNFFDSYAVSLTSDCVFSKLAALPFPVIVTTRHDHTIDHYLRAAGKEPHVVALDIFLGHSPQIPTDFSCRRPLVFYLAGDLAEPESLIVTEDHVLDMVKKIASGNPSLPARLKHQFQASGATSLLVGFGVPKWYTRVILDELGLPRKAAELSFSFGEFNAFLRSADRETAYYYDDEFNIKTILGDTEELVGQVVQEWQGRGSRTPGGDDPSKDGPYVFVSYCSEDRAHAEAIQGALTEAGIASFFDQARMRTGDDWKDRIRKEMDRATAAVLVVSPVLHAKTESITHEEMEMAWERSRRANYNFLFPVWVDGETRPYSRVGESRFDTLSHRPVSGSEDLQLLVEHIRTSYAERVGAKAGS
jgi:hypothetical protein